MFYLVCCRRDLTVSTGNSRCEPRSGFPRGIYLLNAISFENPVKKKESSRIIAARVVASEVTEGEVGLLPSTLPAHSAAHPPPKFQPAGTHLVSALQVTGHCCGGRNLWYCGGYQCDVLRYGMWRSYRSLEKPHCF